MDLNNKARCIAILNGSCLLFSVITTNKKIQHRCYYLSKNLNKKNNINSNNSQAIKGSKAQYLMDTQLY